MVENDRSPEQSWCGISYCLIAAPCWQMGRQLPPLPYKCRRLCKSSPMAKSLADCKKRIIRRDLSLKTCSVTFVT